MFLTETHQRVNFSHQRGKRTSKLSQEQLIQIGAFSPNHNLPCLIEPAFAEVNLTQWTLNHLDWLEDKLLQEGALLFRGFKLKSDDDFLQYINQLPFETIEYNESTTPRTSVKDNIYTSTEFPPEETIAMHHELSAGSVFPQKVWFYCVTPSTTGGQTPIGDGYRIFDRIDPSIRDQFLKKGWSLIRHYGDGVGLDWRQAFHTEEPSQVEAYCKQNDMDFGWLENERLWTRQTRPAILSHPKSGRPVWFNHMAFWHPANLCQYAREEMVRAFGKEGLPYQSYFGDGSPIPDEVARHIADCYQQEKNLFSWQQGDLLLVDNARVTHGREPYTGNRRILVAMAQAFTRDDLPFQPEAKSYGRKA